MHIRTPADLARAVKSRRQAQGRTQQEIADAVGITRQSVARLEQGHAGASFDTVLRVLDHLGLDLQSTSHEPQRPTLPPYPTTDRLPRAVDATNRGIDPSTRTAAPSAAAPTGVTPSAAHARAALLNAAIEAGDPDLQARQAGRTDG